MGADENTSFVNTAEITDDNTTLSRQLESDQTCNNVALTL